MGPVDPPVFDDETGPLVQSLSLGVKIGDVGPGQSLACPHPGLDPDEDRILPLALP